MSQAALNHSFPEHNQGENHRHETGKIPDREHSTVTPVSIQEPFHSICSNSLFILISNRLSNHSFEGLQHIAQH